MDVSQNRGENPPKWMVKIMENPMNKWMIWGGFPGFPIFLETPKWRFGSDYFPFHFGVIFVGSMLVFGGVVVGQAV